MPLFLDTSDLNEIKQVVAMGIITGVTTNPKILAKAGVGENALRELILEIIKVVRGPVSVELTAETTETMLAQARIFAGWNREQVVIKVPMGLPGLQVTATLSKEMGIKTNVTGIMSSGQAYLAAAAGATYVSIFAGRIRDMGYDAAPVIRQTAELIKQEGFSTRIIVGSIRHKMDVIEALSAGGHIVTVTPEVIRKMAWNPNTDLTIAEFNKEWASVNKTAFDIEKIIKG